MIALGLLILTGEFTILNAKANSLLQGTGPGRVEHLSSSGRARAGGESAGRVRRMTRAPNRALSTLLLLSGASGRRHTGPTTLAR